MKISKIFQPRNPLFWIMVALNGLSAVLMWVVHNRGLNALGIVLVMGFAIGNALLGTWIAWRLVRNTNPE